MDLSHLDKKYFIDGRRYNCPFCNRRSVVYNVINKSDFNWSEDKVVYIYLVRCGETDCKGVSMHLSNYDFDTWGNTFDHSPENLEEGKEFHPEELDDYLFFHQPTSFFTVDSRINSKLRELLSEAENCLKMNFLVGASACVRKTIYELINLEKVKVTRKDGHANYTESIKKLKEKYNWVPKDYFDALSNIQELASDNVHEDSWNAWNSPKLRFFIELVRATLYEMYVVPEERKSRLSLLGELKNRFTKDKEIKKDDEK